MKIRLAFFYGCCLIALVACSPPTAERKPTATYLFLGHPYEWKSAGNRIDHRLEGVDFSRFDMVLLGGDVCSQTLADTATLRYIDSIFGIKKPTTLWAVGNHDVMHGEVSRINAQTGRDDFYTTYHNGICFVVLNTNVCSYPAAQAAPQTLAHIHKQAALLRAVCDTLQKASHLVIVHHHILLHTKRHSFAGEFNVADTALQFTCCPYQSFTAFAQPLLEHVQHRGIQVVLIGGDVGAQCKQVEYRHESGILQLGSGINNSVDTNYLPPYVTDLGEDKVLLLEHDTARQQLFYRFIPVEALQSFE